MFARSVITHQRWLLRTLYALMGKQNGIFDQHSNSPQNKREEQVQMDVVPRAMKLSVGKEHEGDMAINKHSCFSLHLWLVCEDVLSNVPFITSSLINNLIPAR